MPPRLLSQGEGAMDGEYISPQSEPSIYGPSNEAILSAENSQLRDLLAQSQAKVAKLERANDVALSALRKHLAPWKKAIDAVFGIIGEDTGAPIDSSKWDAIKARMQPRQRECIDLLLLQGSMRRTAIAAAMKMDYSNCTKNVIGILVRQGWLVDSGGSISLKEL